MLTFNTHPNIGIDTLYKLILFVPPLQEQKKIVEYIENQTKKMDKAINLQKAYIQKLKEYKGP